MVKDLTHSNLSRRLRNTLKAGSGITTRTFSLAYKGFHLKSYMLHNSQTEKLKPRYGASDY